MAYVKAVIIINGLTKKLIFTACQSEGFLFRYMTIQSPKIYVKKAVNYVSAFDVQGVE